MNGASGIPSQAAKLSSTLTVVSRATGVEALSPGVSRPNTYLFGPFRLDTTRRILYCGSVPKAIPERPFQILLSLIRAKGKVVGRETLAQDVWGDEGVTDTNVNQHIYLLRQMLRQPGPARPYILTARREGYRFGAPVTIAPEDEDQFVEEAIRSAAQVLNVGAELFQNYCRGSYLLERRTAESLHEAVGSFQKALNSDPNHVPSLVGLARAYALLAEYWHEPPVGAFGRAGAAASRALRLEPRSSMAHAVTSEVQLFGDWNWVDARRSLTTAIKLNPQSTFARNNAAWFHICHNDLHGALMQARQALFIEPASLALQLLQARVLVHSRRYQMAISELSDILSIDPTYWLARRYRAQAFLLNGMPTEAIQDLVQLPGGSAEDLSFRLPMLARAYADLKDRRATKIFEQLGIAARSAYVPLWNLALAAHAIGQYEVAVRYLQNALSAREPTLLFLRTLPWFEAIEHHSEFRELLQRVGPYQS